MGVFEVSLVMLPLPQSVSHKPLFEHPTSYFAFVYKKAKTIQKCSFFKVISDNVIKK